MGSTKKHKHSECKRRSKHNTKPRSQSPERIKDKHRHKKHHKEKKRERNEHKYTEKISDDEFDAPPPPKISYHSSPPSHSVPPVPPPPTIKDDDIKTGNSNQSLSIDETNRLRAKLGLKPLQIEKNIKSKDNVIIKDSEEFVHKPAENIATKNHQEKLRKKLEEKREKRYIQHKLASVKTLGESDDEDAKDTITWIKHSRKIEEEKIKANKREKLFEELDEEFGIGDIIESDLHSSKRNLYNEKHLSGLRVEHNVVNFQEGSNIILTLKDQEVLKEDDDVLINVNMIDDEKYKKNTKNKNTQSKILDQVDDVDEFGNPISNSLLSKYDEEIDGEKKSSFNIGDDSLKQLQKRKLLEVKEKLKGKLVYSLETPSQIASNYYTQEELVKFNKPKKKIRKIRRKKLRAQELEDLASSDQNPYKDLGSRRSRNTNEFIKDKPIDDDDAMDIDDQKDSNDLVNIKLEPEDDELEFQMALDKARRLRQREEIKDEPPSEIASAVNSIDQTDNGLPHSSICLNATAEFCRTLGDIPTYGLSGNRDDDCDVLMDYDYEIESKKKTKSENNIITSWNEVESVPPTIEEIPKEVRILDAEPDIGTGVAGALKLALSKGYLEKEDQNKPSASRFAHLQAQNYSIEDKSHGDDDKFGRRDRYSGPTTDFKEKDGFKPNVKLDYIDDDGHVLSSKEAFRYLSHKFHGKGPGKNKIEKRMKKNEQEGLMKQMSSTDTPLGTLNLLQQKQKETQSPYIVLSGSKQTTSISKSKH